MPLLEASFLLLSLTVHFSGGECGFDKHFVHVQKITSWNGNEEESGNQIFVLEYTVAGRMCQREIGMYLELLSDFTGASHILTTTLSLPYPAATGSSFFHPFTSGTLHILFPLPGTAPLSLHTHAQVIHFQCQVSDYCPPPRLASQNKIS